MGLLPRKGKKPHFQHCQNDGCKNQFSMPEMTGKKTHKKEKEKNINHALLLLFAVFSDEIFVGLLQHKNGLGYLVDVQAVC